jgi:hypothetical protein
MENIPVVGLDFNGAFVKLLKANISTSSLASINIDVSLSL